MARHLSHIRRQDTLWSKAGQLPRLAFGSMIIILTGIAALVPLSMYHLALAWPYAPLWGALGWGRSGLSLRPMIVLAGFGLVQDVIMAAPLGCFPIINLGVYGLSAAISRETDRMRTPLIAVLAPTMLLALALLGIWAAASIARESALPLVPLIVSILLTGVIYAFIHKAFDLGRRAANGGEAGA